MATADMAVPGTVLSDAADAFSAETAVSLQDSDNSPTASNSDVLSGVTLSIDNTDLASIITTLESQVVALSNVRSVGLTNADRRALLVRSEKLQRILLGLSNTWIADLIANHGLDVLDGSTPDALALLLGLSRRRSGQRIRSAHDFGKRTALTGERLEPLLPNTAAAANEGVLDEEHTTIIKSFFRDLPSTVDTQTRESAETQLSQLARELLPDLFRVAARRLFDILDPDGPNNETNTADRCYFRIGRQNTDGLSRGTFLVDSETRAYLEAAFSKWAKPGMCNPHEPNPVIDESSIDTEDIGTQQQTGPTLFDPDSESSDDGDDDPAAAERARRDPRGHERRQHDALKTILRQMLASKQLGQHRGLPVTAVITMTLKELEEASGHAITATGSLVRMRDAIRMASHAHHYLVIFDNDGRPLHLQRGKRLASADQRIVLLAADRGCTFPGCTRPATWSQVHHIDEWADGGNTDIDSLTLGCDMHHARVGPLDTDWATSKAGSDHPYPGRTLWHPPEYIDPTRTGRVNHYHHPGEYIYPSPQPQAPQPSPPPTSTPTTSAPEPEPPPGD